MKVNVAAGGQNQNPVEIETDDIEDVTTEVIGDGRVGFRLDVLVHTAGQVLRISPEQWDKIRLKQRHPKAS